MFRVTVGGVTGHGKDHYFGEIVPESEIRGDIDYYIDSGAVEEVDE